MRGWFVFSSLSNVPKAEKVIWVRKTERKPGRVLRGRLAGAGTQGRSLFHFTQHRFGSNYSIHHPFEIFNSIASHQALVTGATCPSPTEIKSGSAFSERVDRNGFMQAKKITTIGDNSHRLCKRVLKGRYSPFLIQWQKYPRTPNAGSKSMHAVDEGEHLKKRVWICL